MNISCLQHWIDMIVQYPYFKAIKKFSIKEIKRKKLINELDKSRVFHMLCNFSKETWMPITLNDKNFFMDGQHRLALANQMGLAYIDVIVKLKIS